MATDTTSTFKKVRLHKAAKEFNVSIDALVQHLDEAGYEGAIKGKGINGSITNEDAWLDLQETFSADQATRQRVRELRAERQAEIAATEAADAAKASGDSAPEEAELAPAAAPEPAPEEIESPFQEAMEDAVPGVPDAVPSADIVELADALPADVPGQPGQIDPEPLPDEDVAPGAEIIQEVISEPVEEMPPIVEPGHDTEESDYDVNPDGESAMPVPVPTETTPDEDTEPGDAAADEQPQDEEVAPEPVPAAEPTDAPAAEPAASPETEAVDAPSAEAAPVEAPEAEEAASSEEAEGTLAADRYTLEGTKVIGKIDLSKVIDSSRTRKRKRKRTGGGGDASPSKPTAKPADDRPSKGKKGGKSRKGGPKVDEADAEKSLQETLRELEQGASRIRQRRRRQRRDERDAQREADLEADANAPKILEVTEYVSTGELAALMDVAVTDVITTLFSAGMMVSINQRLDADTITIVADEYGFEVEFITDFTSDDILIEEDDPADLEPRAPIVTIMGHVDHGKTSLLDYIRKANVVGGEAGGITQHIGAYHVTVDDEHSIGFLDTPGHEAFTAMRARGAMVTDVVILVVSADDAVMPQTIEAINHARAAEVPIVVAVNKVDKPDANAPKVMQQLADQDVLVEQYGGKVQCALVSAKTGEGVDELLSKVVLESELLDLKANPNRNAVGTIIEGYLDKGRGVVATVMVQNGTLKIGDTFVAGIHYGRVRAMFDERDRRVQEVGPSKPALVLGFHGQPDVGDQFIVMDEERETKDISQRRSQIAREQSMRQRKHITLDEIGRRLALGDFQELNLIVKGDVGGSVEALGDSLLKLSTEEVAVNIVHSGVGAITESDVSLAVASDAVIIGFQVRPNSGARHMAEQEDIDIRLYSIIYNAISDVRDALEGLLSPEESEKITGVAEVRETFKVPKLGTIAGCRVTEGRIHRNDKVRIIRDGVVIYNGTLASLRRFKDDVREVQSGFECGIGIQGYNDIKVGDQFESYEIVETKRTLEEVA